MALSDWLARRRAVVWFAAVFLGPGGRWSTDSGSRTTARESRDVSARADRRCGLCCWAAPAGWVAAVTTGLAYDYFWIEPYYSFRIFDTQDILTVILLVLVGGAIEQLSWWAGRQRALADRRLGYDRPPARR